MGTEVADGIFLPEGNETLDSIKGEKCFDLRIDYYNRFTLSSSFHQCCILIFHSSVADTEAIICHIRIHPRSDCSLFILFSSSFLHSVICTLILHFE